ncbi:hypothetical protein P168DRAFT_301688 [Aspergillus campestris IBT 28561]|uniref:Tse2 ADP-ribosyltransferase toxin domain-containing protein n=1 Tax=Aspergillus campestris (strain IBT 28561) TaxID=1392248 RepID=A0A2I1DGW2_ASPC2|nr:uncharacterized protein P168DRAFT_301688 [Aspergillus campestris IBT 28561]PKY09115.1 hypothetical protein P168DRAFT_301688 [Aspergillus campestris IBT 28561]
MFLVQNLIRISQGPARGLAHYPNKRAFSYMSMHRTFPATLYRFQTHRDSRLFNRAFEQDDWEYEDGIKVSEDGLVHPTITIDGTNIPKSLNLLRERESRFSLQPARPMSLDSLNQELTRFYLESGRMFTPDDWLGRNPYHEAFFDHLEEWMER